VGRRSEGHDASVINNVLYDFHGNAGTFIYDFTNPANPTLIGAINDPELTYHHQGWTTEDGNYLFICDEASQHPTPDIFVYNISDPSNPQRVGQFGDPDATVHNLFVIGDYAITSYYSAGFRVLDVSDPVNPVVVDEYDTALSSRGGAWGVYPFAPSGVIYVSDIQNGLYLFEVQGITSSVTDSDGQQPESFALFKNYPNPFNPETVISYQLQDKAQVRLDIYNSLGQKIRSLEDEEKGISNLCPASLWLSSHKSTSFLSCKLSSASVNVSCFLFLDFSIGNYHPLQITYKLVTISGCSKKERLLDMHGDGNCQ